jgi:hypothetical protein
VANEQESGVDIETARGCWLCDGWGSRFKHDRLRLCQLCQPYAVEQASGYEAKPLASSVW